MTSISLILPFRDAAPTLIEALDSVRQQTFRDFEVLAINDNSKDESREIVSNYSALPIRLFDNPGNGLVDALNFGLKR